MKCISKFLSKILNSQYNNVKFYNFFEVELSIATERFHDSASIILKPTYYSGPKPGAM